ncbi:MAG TPA: polyprenyl synthetase family protein [Candidatus Limnocylindrales bacterium]|nr:polyprenyl synthetase family protein [Candidatus Limnocylindrales bacterium]
MGSPLRLIDGDLMRVEARIAEVIRAREPLLTEISDYLINAGGKRVRPAVALLVFRACGGTDVTDMVDLSVSLELIHTATLLHDDIIDSNDVRRGKDAAPVRFGIADTLVTGDFLFSRAFQVCGRFEERIVDWAADACVQLTEGEIMQARFRRNAAVTEDDYLEIIARKTASLFAAGTRIAAHLAGLDSARIDRMNECGRQIGLAFQMIDDVLDIEGDPRKTGKRVGTDLLDGNPSLPVVWGLALPAVRRAFLEEGCGADVVEQALSELRSAAIGARVRERAVEHARVAAALVDELPASAFRDAVRQLVSELVDRQL